MTQRFLNRLASLFSRARTKNSRRSRRNRTLTIETMEPRLLLTANLNLITVGASAGQLVFGGSGVNNNTTISFDGTLIRFEDSAENINAIGGLAGKDVNPAANIVEFDPTTLGVPFIQIVVNGNAGDDVLTVNSFRLGAEGLEVRTSAGTDTINLNTNLGGAVAANKIQNEVKLSAENINLNGSIWTADKGVQFTGPVDLLADVVVNSGTGGLTFSGTINGAYSLSTSGLSTKLDGVVGGVTPLTGLTVTDTVANNNVSTKAVTVNGPVLFEADIFTPTGKLSGSGDIVIRPLTPGKVLTLTRGSAALKWLQPGFSSVTIGSTATAGINILKDGNNNAVTGALKIGSPLNLIAGYVNINEHINQEANALTFETDTLTLAELGSAKGSGDVNIKKLTAGGTLRVLGSYGSGIGNVWGLSNITINASGAAVAMDTPLGSAPKNFKVVADSFSHAYSPAINVHGDVELTVGTLTLGAGIFSAGGNVTISGNASLASNTLFRVSPTKSLIINGDINGNGKDLGIVGSGGGAIASVDLNGFVNDIGAFSVTPGAAGAADEVTLNILTAKSIAVNGKEIYLATTLFGGGGLAATAGNLQLIGKVEVGAVVAGTIYDLLGSGLAGSKVQVDGTIDGVAGTETLRISSVPELVGGPSLGSVVLNGVVGGVTPLANLYVSSGGTNVITQNISVSNDFKWKIATEQLVNGDNLTLNAGKTVTAGNSIDINVIDRFFGDISSLLAPSKSVIEGGNP